MSVPTKPVVDDATAGALAALALGQTDMLEQAEDLREQLRQSSGLDPRSFSLVKIAALVAVDAPPASFLWQVGAALDAGRQAARHPGRPHGDRAAGRDAAGGGRRARDHAGARP